MIRAVAGVLALSCLRGLGADFAPDQPVVEIPIETLEGAFLLSSPDTHRPAVIVAVDLEDASSRWMWQNAKSKFDFVAKLPNVDCIFISYSDKDEAVMDVRLFQSELRDAAKAAKLTDAAFTALFSRLHFAVQPVSDQPGWLPDLLQAWPSSQHIIKAHVPGAEALTMQRLDPAFEWLPWPGPRTPIPLALVQHDACQDPWSSDVAGHAALVIPTSPAQVPYSNGNDTLRCSYARMIQLAQAAKAAAVLVASQPGHDVVQMICNGPGECSLPLVKPATMIGYDDAAKLRDIIMQSASGNGQVAISFADEQVPGYYAALDEERRLQEVGWQKFPTLMHVVWEAQWLVYMQELRQRLAFPALIVPVFQDVVMHGEHGTAAEVTIPDKVFDGDYNILHLDFALGCPGSRDVDCPIWDHVVQLFVCCDDPVGLPCEPCPTTVWAAPNRSYSEGPLSLSEDPNAGPMASPTEWPLPVGHMPFNPAWQGGDHVLEMHNASTAIDANTSSLSGISTSAAHRRRLQSTGMSSRDGQVESDLPGCGRELGRWITPFRRRIGRWLTDVTPLLGLLSSSRCHFHIQTAPWALPWKPSLNLRFSHASLDYQSSVKAQGRPRTRTIKLFEGGTFVADYNSRRSPVEVTTPAGLVKAVIAAVITGHGSDENNCAEFCPTSHHFSVNGHEHLVNFTNAGTTWGCADQVPLGVEPNEHGTWQYGRNGWCDGQQVNPTVFDVTEEVANDGKLNNITYKGLFRGLDPNPKGNPGYIMMQSSLILYLKSESSPS
ncbi:hypothetical protein WJX74_010910 [Apatococcus lobatus]|uniref:Peptide-N-glycosidase F N-terminal domain-containing protein n=1 Tax=Apatococcus lobatus TaxID=904363 RepID=A0AAW1RRW4_9CHLO